MACFRNILTFALLACGWTVGGSSCAHAQFMQYPTQNPASQSKVDARTTNSFGVAAPLVPDYATAGPGSQHRSMSPDSWDTSQHFVPASYPAVPGFQSAVHDLTRQAIPQTQSNSQTQFSPESNAPVSPYGSTDAADVAEVLVEKNAPPTLDYQSTTAANMKILEQSKSPFKPAVFSKPTNTSQIDEAASVWVSPSPSDLSSANSSTETWQPPAAMIIEQPNPFQNNGMMPLGDQQRYPLLTPNPQTQADSGRYVPAPMPMNPLPPVETLLPNQVVAGTLLSEPLGGFDSVGRRRPFPTRRANLAPLDDGEKFAHESKKRDYPQFSEIIATGRFFYSAEVLWGEPQFQGNNAISTEASNFGESIPFDFDSDFHPRIRLGFESKYGPGVELSYFNLNSNSELESFTSDGSIVGHSNAWVIGRNEWSRIFANDPGETLVTQHSIDIDSAAISFFKELQFPISRINGNFGFQYVSIAQELNANVNDASGGSVESLRSTTDMRAFGPRVILEYYRPVGHTPLEFVTSFGGSVLFGQRDQFVSNSQTGLLNRVGADEFLTILDFMVGAQYTKTIGENRAWFARFGFVNQTWIGGGTAAFPQGDFGIRGLTFGIGYNR